MRLRSHAFVFCSFEFFVAGHIALESYKKGGRGDENSTTA